MHNEVVEAVSRVYRDNGFTSMRFNFRGVGRSGGVYDHGAGERVDVLRAVEHLSGMGKSEIHLAGYSFGAWINGMALPFAAEVACMVMVSPPVALLDFNEMEPDERIKLVVTGTEDDLAPESAVREAVTSWNPGGTSNSSRAGTTSIKAVSLNSGGSLLNSCKRKIFSCNFRSRRGRRLLHPGGRRTPGFGWMVIQTGEFVMQSGAVDAGDSRVSEMTREAQMKEVIFSIRRLMQAGEMYTKELGKKYQVSAPQLYCLLTLNDHGPLPPSQIARYILVKSSTVTGIVDRLEQKGLVRRVRNSRDRRVINIELTDKGRALAGNAPPPIQRTIMDGLKRVSDGQLTEITRGLKLLTDMLDVCDLEVE
jgi:DNA-binding MarR family transcriptional regulator